MAQLTKTAVTGSLIVSGSVLQLPIYPDAQTGSIPVASGSWWYNSTSNQLNYRANGTICSI